MGAGLEAEELAAEGAGVDGEVAGGGGTVWEGFGEEIVVGFGDVCCCCGCWFGGGVGGVALSDIGGCGK